MYKNTESIDIELLIAGDESAFDRVYHLYAEKVYRLAFRFLKNEKQCEEIVQETFIKLWLNRLKLDPSGNLWLYLYVISKRLSLDAYKEICKSSVLTEKLLTDLRTTRNTTEEDRPVGTVVWSPDGKILAYNRFVENNDGRNLQIFLIQMD